MRRQARLSSECHYDVCIVGGGIYGAWSAYHCANAGLKVILLEGGDWASGTSTASSKLIHGGLRYLEHKNFKLVKKSLVERQWLLDASSGRIRPLKFMIPHYSGARVGKWRLRLGLYLYDFLAGTLGSKWSSQFYQRNEMTLKYPMLQAEGLEGALSYFDAYTDDGRYVLELVDASIKASAHCINYMKVESICQEGEEINSLNVCDIPTGEKYELCARSYLFTCGTGLNQLFDTSSVALPKVKKSKGVHLVMPDAGLKEAFLLFSNRDGRVFFVIPWYGRTILGTTDTEYREGDVLKVNECDRSYLLESCSKVLKGLKWTEEDIIGEFAGLRVLQNSNDQNMSNLTREWVPSPLLKNGWASIGGKLTSARVDAIELADKAIVYLNKGERNDQIKFPWRVPDEKGWLRGIFDKGLELGLDRDMIDLLIFRHGRRIEKIYALIIDEPTLSEVLLEEHCFIKADLVFCAKEEMILHLDDLIRRRMPLILLCKMWEDKLDEWLDLISPILCWDKHIRAREKGRVLGIYAKNKISKGIS